MRTVLVTGGTGELGRLVVARLQARGHRPRVLTHRSTPLPGVESVRGDLLDGSGLDAALRGADTVVHAATAPARGAAGAVDVAGTHHLLQAARAGGAHLIYPSIVGVDRIPIGYYRAKLAAEQAILSSAQPFTLQRATQFHALLLRLLAALSRPPVLVLPTGLRLQPVDPGEVADLLVRHVEAGPGGRAPDFGGPQVLSARELARSWLRASGKRRLVVSLPLPGRAGAALRAGANLCPDTPRGRRTWAEAVADARAGACLDPTHGHPGAP